MLYTQLVLRVRLVVVELVDAYGREHRVEDRELARGEAADHDAPCVTEQQTPPAKKPLR